MYILQPELQIHLEERHTSFGKFQTWSPTTKKSLRGSTVQEDIEERNRKHYNGLLGRMLYNNNIYICFVFWFHAGKELRK